MRIISNFNDYYDSVQVYYSDDVIFKRINNVIILEKEIYCTSSSDTMLYFFNTLQRRLGIIYHSTVSGCLPDCTTLTAIGVTGNLQFHVRYYFEDEKLAKKYNTTEYFTMDELVDHITKSKSGFPTNNWFNQFLANTNVENRLIELFEKHQTPIFTVGTDLTDKKRCINYYELQLNTSPVLNDFKFFKIQDAYTIYQNIEMYLTNELAKPDNPEQITDNIVLRDAKGFDEWSFKKLPTKHKKRRKQ